ncbi:MAG: RelA/SpoT family protein [Bacteroidota bacterium]
MKLSFDLGLRKKSELITDDYRLGENPQNDLTLLLNECKLHLPKFDENRIKKAFEMCYNAHLNKLRKSGEPFYTHPLEVARIVMREIPLDEDAVVAALLHNVVDEGELYSYDDIRHEFGVEVAQIVDGVSKIKYVESQHINSEVQAENYRRLLLALFKDVRIILIKLADRLHNMRTLESLNKESQERASRETLEIYAPFANRFGLRNIKWELEDLAFKYLHPDKYEAIRKALQLTRKEREEYIVKFIEPIEKALSKDELLKKLKIKYEITGRAKHIYSIYNKTILRQKSIDELYDLFAVRVILDTDDRNMCFYVYGIVAGIYPPVPETFKDYISAPKKNGYQSIHSAVVGPSNKPVEVQIRTRQMHLVSEKGVAAHFKYKSGVKSSSLIEDVHLQKWMDDVREIFENAGDEKTPELLESVRRNLFIEDIYVFTPANELKKLPRGATALDFAFEIHTKVGYHAIGAKINGRVAPLYYKLENGDRVEILVSKNQKPTKEWLKWVTTGKASQALLKYIRDEIKRYEAEGKQIWTNKLKELGITLNEDEIEKLLKSLKFIHISDFYAALADKTVNQAKINDFLLRKVQEIQNDIPVTDEIQSLFSKIPNLEIHPNITLTYANCCNPKPGEDIIAVKLNKNFATIHKIECSNVEKVLNTHKEDLAKVSWEDLPEKSFLIEIRVIGDDREYMLQDITASIIKSGNASINSVNINTIDTIFDGVITLKINNKSNINRVLEEILKINGIKQAEVVK